MPQILPLKEFLLSPGPMLDVRTLAEFTQGRIPESHSLPLFNSEERAQIGTLYKRQGQQEAIELGLLLITPKIDEMMNILASTIDSHGRILCWRGGMRSGFAARLTELLGKSACTLQGGYKTYRRWAIKQLENFHFPDLKVLGGLTGSGKTFILKSLQIEGEQVIDLEEIANHRGSAFGGIGLSAQPSQEQFENELAAILSRLDPSKPVWIEDESRLIGRCNLPTSLYQRLTQAPLLYIERPLEERIQTLLDQYGEAPAHQLLASLNCIIKRLGSELTNEIRRAIEEGKIDLAFEKLLLYYDKGYQHSLAKRRISHRVILPPHSSFEEWASICQRVT